MQAQKSFEYSQAPGGIGAAVENPSDTSACCVLAAQNQRTPRRVKGSNHAEPSAEYNIDI